MPRPLRIALAQLYSTPEFKTNIKNLEQAVEQAARDKCQLIVFPEYYTQGIVAEAPHKVFEDKSVHENVCDLAKRFQIDIVIGTLVEKVPESKQQDSKSVQHKTYNT
jgi:predicted amidohydrolase